MRNLVLAPFALAAAAALPAQHPAEQHPAGQHPAGQHPAATALRLTFGVYSFKRPSEVYQQFQPAISALREAMTAALGRPVAIELGIRKTYEECLESFVAGEIDFVRFGPASYVLARERQPAIQLLAAENEDSAGVGLIVVRADSEIRTLADLKGRRFAFGDDQSTIGRFLSQAELARAGVRADTLSGYAYLGRHDKVFKAVEIGDFEAGALHKATFEELNKDLDRTRLRVLHSFDNIGKPWIARAGLDPRVVRSLRRCLLEMRDPDALQALKAPGFVETPDRAFEFVREGMRLSEQFQARPAPSRDGPAAAPAGPHPAPPPGGPGKGP